MNKQEPLETPIYIRLPKPGGRCPISALSRSSMNELIDSGRVKCANLKQGKKTRGIKLIVRQSLIDYLKSLEQ